MYETNNQACGTRINSHKILLLYYEELRSKRNREQRIRISIYQKLCIPQYIISDKLKFLFSVFCFLFFLLCGISYCHEMAVYGVTVVVKNIHNIRSVLCKKLQHLFFAEFRNAACSPNDWFLFMNPQMKTNHSVSSCIPISIEKKVLKLFCDWLYLYCVLFRNITWYRTVSYQQLLSLVFMMLEIGPRSRMKKKLTDCNDQSSYDQMFKYDFFSVRDIGPISSMVDINRREICGNL